MIDRAALPVETRSAGALLLRGVGTWRLTSRSPSSTELLPMPQERHRIPAPDTTEVYVTKEGQIAIAQEGLLDGEPRTVYLEPGDIPAIVHWLQECAFDA